MADYVISCCSTADLTLDHFKKRDLEVAKFHFEIDGKPYLDDGEFPIEDFYNAMAKGAMTKTSQINVDEYINHFTPFLEEGKDIIHLTLSSGISGTINSANIAADELREKYPERKIYIIDSLAASSGYGLLMDTIADKRDAGMTIDELKNWVLEHRLELNHWFFTTDLTYLVRGGRVSKAAGWFGGALKICPLLNVDNQGRLIARQKLRGKPAVIKACAKKMLENALYGDKYNGKCYISQSACRGDADQLIKEVEALIPGVKGRIEVYDIGTTIGSHTGPGTIALFFWGNKRED
ncbi:DegV family protein [Butyrivibrio sp. INlla16]|uniref:DegV family protein n=1 Tax=Butyrivibrio sp. INlla16 TaxID=1520807 RepID=UPI000881CC65|nr:DegV family protein [Butyrivibrio sp. INlla16]SDB41247.1 EDD domain protein, DegV family [Butyrivibrio sp. INlla16]